jgi:two-component system chemotaxis sensor kinase CheA
MNNDLTPEEIQIFLQECIEHLEALEQNLISLEEEPSNIALVQEAFRSAHTIKGSTAAAGFEEMSHLTHVMESWLDHIRNGVRTATPDVIDRLLAGVDILRRALRNLEKGESIEGLDFVSVAEMLDTTSAQVDKEEAAAAAAVSEIPKELIKDAEGPVIHWIIKIDSTSLMPSVKAFQVLLVLEEYGDILWSEPSLKSVEEAEAPSLRKLEALVATSASAEAICSRIMELGDLEEIKYIPHSRSEKGTEKPKSNTGLTESTKNTQASPAASTVRIEVEVLDKLMNLVGELVIDRTQLIELCRSHKEVDSLYEDLEQITNHFSRATTDLQDIIMKARMMPIETLFKRFPRMMRDLSKELNKPIDFQISGEDTELDRSVIEQISDPLIHLLRNAVDHGLEKTEDRIKAGKSEIGTIRLCAYHQQSHIYIEVSDDGRGISSKLVREMALAKGLITEEQAMRLSPEDVLELIFVSGFSTASKVSSVSGRGVGLDVVQKCIEKVNGSISVRTQEGQGTTWIIELPLTLAIVQGLMVMIADNVYAVPISAVVEVLHVRHSELDYAMGKPVIKLREQVIPLVNPGDVWGETYWVKWSDRPVIPVAILKAGTAPFGLMVDKLLGEQEVVIKSMGPLINDSPGISGASILGDGQVALIIDITGLSKEVRFHARSQ